LLIRTSIDSRANISRTVESLERQTYPHWLPCILKSDRDRSSLDSPTIPQNCEYVGIVGAGDTLAPDALYEFARAIVERSPRPDVLYCDEDHLAIDGRTRSRPVFKPSWSPEMLLAYNYPGRLTVVRSELLDDVGGLDLALGAPAEWDLMLRLSERTQDIVRVPRCLYHNSDIEAGRGAGSSLDGAQSDNRLVLEAHLKRAGQDRAQAVPQANGTFRVTWPLSSYPMVSVIIPTRDSPGLIRTCVEGLLHGTAYPNKQILLVDNGSTDPETLSLYRNWSTSGSVSIVLFNQPFNYSIACNRGASGARGEYLLFLNNDVEIIHSEWLEELVRWGQMPGIGIVGTKLVYPDGKIQHAGVTLSSYTNHLFAHDRDDPESKPAERIFGTPNVYRNVTALTGACQLISRPLFDRIGGYDERSLITSSDIILCLKASSLGYRNLYTPYAALIHHEGKTRGLADVGDDLLLLVQLIDELGFREDPYFHPELNPACFTPAIRPIWTPTARDFLRRQIEDIRAALPSDGTSIAHDRSSLMAFLDELTHHSTGAHWSISRVGRDVEAATWFVIDTLREDRALSLKFPRALSDGAAGEFCRWLCSEGIGRYGLASNASETIHAAFASQPGDPVSRLIETKAICSPSFRVARLPSLLPGLLTWLVRHRKEHGIPDLQIWWFLLESVEDPIRDLTSVYRTSPDWQRHFPDAFQRTGWNRFARWVRDRYGFDATGHEFELTPSPPGPPEESKEVDRIQRSDIGAPC
jgi:GT2 family glycosyltransferase